MFDSDRAVFELTSWRTGLVYRTERPDEVTANGVRCGSGNTLEIELEAQGHQLHLTVSLEGCAARFDLSFGEGFESSAAFAFPGEVTAPEQDQYFAVPYAEGLLTPVTQQHPYGEYIMWGHKSTMPFTGVTGIHTGTGIMLVSEDFADTSVTFRRRGGSNYRMMMRHFPQKGEYLSTRTFYFTVIEENGYVAMAKWYRNHLLKRGEIVALSDRAQQNPNIRKLVGAADVWLGDHTKNREVVDDIIFSGVGKALFNFQYGWYVYDSEKRPDLIRHVNEQGMIASRYDNYTDVFEPSAAELSPRFRIPGYDNDCIRNSDGTRLKGYHVNYKGHFVQGYRLNPSTQTGVALDRIGEDLEENSYNGRFIDVNTSDSLHEDYSENHPADRFEHAMHRRRILGEIRRTFNFVMGSEESRHWAMGVTDYGEGTMTIEPAMGAGYGWYTPVDDPGAKYMEYNVNPAVRIPLVSLVYHDAHISTWYTGDGVSKVPAVWAVKDLFTALYGTMQLVSPPDLTYWRSNRGKFLHSIYATTRVFDTVGYSEMTNHRFLTDDRLVQQTEFGNGYSVVANFGQSGYECCARTVPPMGFTFLSGNNHIFVYSHLSG